MKPAIMLFLLIIPFASAIEINEIMYNPPGDDAGNEWIELFNPENLDLANWSIGDLSSNDTLIPVRISNSQFALIVENSSAFPDSNASIYYAGSLIGNGLGNAGDTIYLYDLNKTPADFLAYNSTFANGNNKTLEKFNNSWRESAVFWGTPGFENSVSAVFSNFTNSTNETQTNSTVNDTNQTNSTAQNETANQTNSTVCVSSIQISTTKEIYTDEAIKFRHIVNSSAGNFSIIYWIEDLFGNIMKEKYETKTLTEKSYTPHPDERDKIYVIKSVLIGCNESYAEKNVIFKTEKEIAEDKPVEAKTGSSAAEENKNKTKPKFTYELLSYSEEILQDSEASAIVQITSDDSPHEIYMQAYIYRYSKKYSDIAEYEFTVEKSESQAVELNSYSAISEYIFEYQ